MIPATHGWVAYYVPDEGQGEYLPILSWAPESPQKIAGGNIVLQGTRVRITHDVLADGGSIKGIFFDPASITARLEPSS